MPAYDWVDLNDKGSEERIQSLVDFIHNDDEVHLNNPNVAGTSWVNYQSLNIQRAVPGTLTRADSHEYYTEPYSPSPPDSAALPTQPPNVINDARRKVVDFTLPTTPSPTRTTQIEMGSSWTNS